MTRPTGTAAAVREYLRQAGTRGATPRDIRIAIDHDANGISTALANMLSRGKIDRRDGRYYVNASTFVDGRGGSRVPKAAAHAPGTQGVAKPKPTPEASVSIARAFLPSLTIHVPGIEARRPAREAIAADVAAFLKAGGVIQRFAPGETAESVREKEARIAREYGRAKAPRKPRAKRAA